MSNFNVFLKLNNFLAEYLHLSFNLPLFSDRIRLLDKWSNVSSRLKRLHLILFCLYCWSNSSVFSVNCLNSLSSKFCIFIGVSPTWCKLSTKKLNAILNLLWRVSVWLFYYYFKKCVVYKMMIYCAMTKNIDFSRLASAFAVKWKGWKATLQELQVRAGVSKFFAFSLEFDDPNECGGDITLLCFGNDFDVEGKQLLLITMSCFSD